MIQDANDVGPSEGNTDVRGTRERADGPAESETPGMQRNFMRENRETRVPWQYDGPEGERDER